VAIARALAQRPRLLLCEEPTGHLDTDTTTRVLEMIETLQDRFSFTLVVATHDADIAAGLGRVSPETRYPLVGWGDSLRQGAFTDLHVKVSRGSSSDAIELATV
jgi:ABC-type phosphate transport system ATPase subunit